MAFLVVAEPPDEFAQLAGAAARAPRPTPTDDLARRGQEVFLAVALRRCATPSRARRRAAASAPTSPTSPAGARSPPARCPTRAATWPAGSSIRRRSSPARKMPPNQLEPPRSAGAAGLPGDAASERATAERRRRAGPRAGRRPRAGAQLEQTWRSRPGLWGWLTSVDHKSIGKRYIVTAFVFFLLGGIEARADAAAARAAREHAPRPRRLQPDLHHARHDDDVPLRRAGDGGDGPLPRAADDRRAQRRVPAAERLRLLDLPVRRPLPVRQASS